MSGAGRHEGLRTLTCGPPRTRVTENCQRLAGSHARQAVQGGPDFFGEEETLRQLENYLLAVGVPDEKVQAQLLRLQRADPALPPDPRATLEENGRLRWQPAPPVREK